MINLTQWLSARRKLLAQVKAQVHLRLGPEPRALKVYAARAAKDFDGAWKPAPPAALRQAIQSARIVCGADFHAYAQAQRAHLRVLRDQVGERPVILALECLRAQDEPFVRQFIMGKISGEKLKAKINWQKHWGFPWEPYRALLELARDREMTVIGIGNPSLSDLNKRDQVTAARLNKAAGAHPEALVYAIIGEWHLASAHLPGKLEKLFPRQVVVIFQDVEKLYFRLAAKKLESSVELLRTGKNKFCLMVSPPWMKWQSYLMFLEESYDRELQDEISVDYSDHVKSLVELLEQDLKIETKKSRIQVYGANSRPTLPKTYSRKMLYYLRHDLSFYSPERDFLYLSRPTINHASTLAGQFVHAHLCRRTRNLWLGSKDFLPLIWVEAVGFFFSKWINPKRKPETLEAIRLQLEGRHPRDLGREALQLALDQRLTEVLFTQTGRLRTRRFRPRSEEIYFDAARIIGSMLGERLFQKVRSRTISLPTLMGYLKIKVENKSFDRFYWRLVRELELDV